MTDENTAKDEHSAQPNRELLDDAWHAAEPDQGHAEKAAEWRAKLSPNAIVVPRPE